MINVTSFKKAWSLLESRERRSAFRVLGLMIVAALSSAIMVGSVFPFLSILADPQIVNEVSLLSWLYEFGNFETDYGFLVGLGLGTISVIVMANLMLMFSIWAVVSYTSKLMHSISRRLFAHYMAQNYDFFLRSNTASISSNIFGESQIVVQQFLRPLADSMSASLTIFAVVMTLLIADPVVALTTIAIFVGAYGAIILISQHYARVSGQRRAEANQARFKIAGEALNGIKDVKLLGREAIYLDRYDAASSKMAQSLIGVGVIAQLPHYAIQILVFGGIIVLSLVLLDPSGLQERSALGEFLPMVGLMAFAGQRMMPEFGVLFSSITHMRAGAAALDKVCKEFDRGENVRVDRMEYQPIGLTENLKLDGLQFTYPNAERAGLLDVELNIQAGECIGVVGLSGAGKTTLADVLLGLLIPEHGTISCDGTLITDNNRRAWQKTVGYVPQDIFLIDASLYENIAFGVPPEEIDAGKVVRCAKIAQLHEFVSTDLPDGYETTVGERGIQLSGGQRQRIGIARAIYHDADLIVFDEATSALDNLTERELMGAIEALGGDKTLIIIAHRLSTVKSCDRIVVMKRGQVVDFATWDQLVQWSSSFKELTDTN